MTDNIETTESAIKKIKKISATAQASAILRDYCLLEDGSYDLTKIPPNLDKAVMNALRVMNPTQLMRSAERKNIHAEFRKLAQASSPEIFSAIEEIALDPSVYEQVRIQAGDVILNRAFGTNKMTFIDLKSMLEGRDTEGQLDVIIAAVGDGTIAVEIGKKAEILQSEKLMLRMADLEAQLANRRSPVDVTPNRTIPTDVAKPAVNQQAIDQSAAPQVFPVEATPVDAAKQEPRPKTDPYTIQYDGNGQPIPPVYVGPARQPKPKQVPSWAIKPVSPSDPQPPYTNVHAAE